MEISTLGTQRVNNQHMKVCAVKILTFSFYEKYNIMFLFSIVEPKSMNVEVFSGIEKSQGLKKHQIHSDMAFKHDLSCFAVASDSG